MNRLRQKGVIRQWQPKRCQPPTMRSNVDSVRSNLPPFASERIDARIELLSGAVKSQTQLRPLGSSIGFRPSMLHLHFQTQSSQSLRIAYIRWTTERM